MRDLTVDLLKHLFDYDKETGNLIWKKTRANGKVKKGDIAGTIDSKGYIRLDVNYKKYKAHRLVFLMHKGYLPKTIDHINGNPSDNRIENLRAATTSQNQYNRKLSSNNTSGFKGVSWDKTQKIWKGYIYLDGQRIHLGVYKTPEEANEVVRKAREELHGEFANHGEQ
jgi:hypothetical protein